MYNQLDLFECAITEEEMQQKHDKAFTQKKLNPRCWRLFDLICHNSLIEHRKTTQKEICDKLGELGYKWNNDPKCHDHCTMVWTDISKLNLSGENDKVIISDNFEYWVGNEEETKEFLDKLWNDLLPRLVRYWSFTNKVAKNGQGQLFSTKLDAIEENSKARRFIESYGEERIG